MWNERGKCIYSEDVYCVPPAVQKIYCGCHICLFVTPFMNLNTWNYLKKANWVVQVPIYLMRRWRRWWFSHLNHKINIHHHIRHILRGNKVLIMKDTNQYLYCIAHILNRCCKYNLNLLCPTFWSTRWCYMLSVLWDSEAQQGWKG